MHVLDMLKERGFIAQVTFEDDLYKALEREPMTFYLGIDPTADSLHVGHFMPIIVAGYLQRAGHRPIILCGGGTAMIGDPSGKSDLRKMMSRETICENAAFALPGFQRRQGHHGQQRRLAAESQLH